jgi:serine protease inhibitor
MRKILLILVLITLMILCTGCTTNQGVETKSKIVDKQVIDGNQYYFMVTYKIDGLEGDFEATIKINKKATFDSYAIGDEYIFYRPSTK